MALKVRRLALLALLAVIVGLPIVTLWLVLPTVREPCIRSAFQQSVEPSFWWPSSWKRELEILKKLRQPVTLQFIETPFVDVADFLHDFLGVPIELVDARLKQKGTKGDPTVTIAVQNISLASVWKLILDEQEAKCRIEGGAIRITDRKRGESTLPALAIVPPDSMVVQDLRNKLQDPITLHFEAAPFANVIDFLQTSVDINIVVDQKRLDLVGLESETTVTIRQEAVPLKDALSTLLDPFQATFRVDDEVLFITTNGRTAKASK